MRKQKGFTLIELLVVIAIIALLMSVLFPALKKARDSARVMSCQANSKQIALMVELHQVDNNGRVPVLFNRFAPDVPARSELLSLALSDYWLSGSLPSAIDPEGQWVTNNSPILADYMTKHLEKFFVCPYVRSKSPELTFLPGNVTIGNKTYKTMEQRGYYESYSVWRWDRPKGTEMVADHPLQAPHGIMKYGTVSWNGRSEYDISDVRVLLEKPVSWTGGKFFRRAKSGGPGGATIFYCEQGQTDNYSDVLTNGAIFNYGSHKKKGTGGTTAAFADGHVEWVPGTQIGWP